MPPVTRALLILNVACYVLTIVLRPMGIDLNNLFGLHFFLASDFNVLQLVTYMFLHGSLTHLLFNMFSLWMFGRIIERSLSSRAFLIYYMVCGIGAGLCQELWQFGQYHLEGLAAYDRVNLGTTIVSVGQYLNYWTTIGASGACYGILLAFGMLYPDERIILLIPPIPIKAKYFVIGYAVIEVLSAYSSNDNIAHFAHLGGMLFGFILLRYRLLRRYVPGSRWQPRPSRSSETILARVRRFFRPGETRPGNAAHAPRRTVDQEYNLRQRQDEARMDAILDKIHRSGYDSLTEEEKRELFRISRK